MKNIFRSFRMTALALALSLPVAAMMFNNFAQAQNTTSGDLQGTVTDSTGAVVPGATITLTGNTTGSVQKLTSSASGGYHAAFLKPGSYTISVTAPNFETTTVGVNIELGSTASGDIKLTVGKTSTTVEVGADTVPLLQTEDAQISTSFTQEQIETLPNPGGDITYYAQTAPGVIMNTGQGEGNFSVFGLPGTSNNFTVNGEQENDPFLNLNNSGPTNLLLGQNDISSVSVLTNAFGAEFGSFGGAQVNEISRSGGNKFHGDASYWWNGRAVNANNYFNKGAGNPRPFSNDNQWAASIGGPIIKDKTFFFVDTEGLRFITAEADTNFIPSASYEAGIVGDGSCSTGSLAAAGNAAECGLYNQIFALYNNAPGAQNATSYDPNTNIFVSTPKVFAKESLVTARLDQVISSKDSAFIHFKYDNGTQPTNVDPISPVFNAVSYQPEDEGQLVETHTFTPNLVNQFLVTVAHYSAYFQSVDQAAATAALPFTAVWEDEAFDQLGGAQLDFPQGRNATQYQFADDLSWTKKSHSFKAGYAFKKDDITNFDTGIYIHPLNFFFNDGPAEGLPTTAGFDAGYSYEYRQAFPLHLSNPNGLYSEGFYGQDTWKAASNLNLTYGIRFEHNSNPVCQHQCFSRLNSSFENFLSSDANSNDGAYNASIATGLTQAFSKFEAISYEPRFEVVYSPTTKMAVRGGFGMFSDVFPGQVADNLLRNTPQDTRFQVYEAPLLGSLPTSGTAVAAASNQIFLSGTSNFYNGGSYNSIHAIAPGFIRPNFSTAEPSVKYPTYEEFSLQVQYAFTPTTSFQVAYAGNHGYHEPTVAENSNAYDPYNDGFVGLPSSRPANPFGAVTNLSSTSNSNYNGLLVSVIHHSKYATAQLNYTYSHTLDQISNGGFLDFTTSSITGPLAPNNLAYNYGNADYDIRHSLNGNYLVNVPGYGGQALRMLTDGWQVAGTVFYRAGFPFTVVDPNVSGDFINFTNGAVPAQPVGKLNHHCGNEVVTTGCLGANTGTQDLATADFVDPTSFIPGQRNAFSGPHYFNTDMTLNKSIKLPAENIKLTIGAVAYNLFNHPNFLNPDGNATDSTFGQSFFTANVPTSIYGAALGGDASIRILQLHAKVSF
jgi:hypothetical protein